MSSTGLFCQHCGELNDASAQFCHKCGAAQTQLGTSAANAGTSVSGASSPYPVSPSAYTPAEPPPYPVVPSVDGHTPPGWPPAPVAAAANFRGYAGFWIRFVAVMIDGVVLSLVTIPFIIVVFGAFGGSAMIRAGNSPQAQQEAVFSMFRMMPVLVLGSLAIHWLYEALLTSSSKQGTLGKMVLSLKVTDKEGRRLSFAHATGRYFAKLINGFTMNIGYIMAGFTERKQGLHDMIAGTYVIKG